ncbi:MAG: BrnA antitoxin family protein [Candidatus Binatus sp.]|uniref:BrnA antitoxin family protein n=1 Tax=Candidatus Binatus sp. TaxID=2811406 RepID=UPI002716225D|nr:BrnA antitoxin family protein [Candidatus Binatus sp.]MDO8434798.1 BrnA antitoxin family protein [Candidatus Binatus sp.]
MHTRGVRKAKDMKREYDFSKGKRGAVVPPEPGKTRITIRLDNKVLDYFREQVHAMGGGNYQSLINEALREHMRRGGIEAVVRRAVREELKDAGIKRVARG